MTLEEISRLSCYKDVYALSDSKRVMLVANQEDGRFYVKKTLTVYDREIFAFLKVNPLPGIPRIYECVEDGDTLIIIEQYINGTTLEQFLESHGPLNLKKASEIVLSICEILSPLHKNAHPIIHRDIKPSNIILTEGNTLTLIDFNAAKFLNLKEARDTRLIGTQGFAAPEQYGFRPSTVQTDIFAIGVLYNILLTGHGPQQGMAQGWPEDIIEKCIQMDPDKRYTSIDKLMKAIQGKLYGIPWLPPGMRSLHPAKIVASGIGYAFWAWLSAGLHVEGANARVLLANRITFFLCGLFIVFFSADYMRIWERLHITDIRNKAIRFLMIALFEFLAFSWMILILLMMEKKLK